MPVPVTLADKTGEITFAVTSATLLYPLVIAGDYVPHWGEPLFAKDLKSLRVGKMRYLRSEDSIFVPQQLTVGTEEANAAESIMEDGGNPALRLLRSNTLGDEEIVIHSMRKEPGSVEGSGGG